MVVSRPEHGNAEHTSQRLFARFSSYSSWGKRLEVWYNSGKLSTISMYIKHQNGVKSTAKQQTVTLTRIELPGAGVIHRVKRGINHVRKYQCLHRNQSSLSWARRMQGCTTTFTKDALVWFSNCVALAIELCLLHIVEITTSVTLVVRRSKSAPKHQSHSS